MGSSERNRGIVQDGLHAYALSETLGEVPNRLCETVLKTCCTNDSGDRSQGVIYPAQRRHRQEILLDQHLFINGRVFGRVPDLRLCLMRSSTTSTTNGQVPACGFG